MTGHDTAQTLGATAVTAGVWWQWGGPWALMTAGFLVTAGSTLLERVGRDRTAR